MSCVIPQDQSTAIHLACRGGRDRIISTLLSFGADVNSRNGRDTTPLMIASGKGFLEVVRLLVDNNADPTLKNKHGNSALLLSIHNGHEKVAEFLMCHNPWTYETPDRVAVRAMEKCMLVLVQSLIFDPIVRAELTASTALLKAACQRGQDFSAMLALVDNQLVTAAQAFQLYLDDGHPARAVDVLHHYNSIDFSYADLGALLFGAVKLKHCLLVTELLRHGADPETTALNKSQRLVSAIRLAAEENALDVLFVLARAIAAKGRQHYMGDLVLDRRWAEALQLPPEMVAQVGGGYQRSRNLKVLAFLRKRMRLVPAVNSTETALLVGATPSDRTIAEVIGGMGRRRR